LATIYLATQFSHLADFARILSAGQPLWLGWAMVGLAARQLIQAAQFRAAYRAVAVEQSLLSLLPVVAANNFVVLADPTGSLSTFALFLAHARRHSLSPERSAVAVAVWTVFQYLALVIVIGLALAALAAYGVLYPIEWLLAIPVFALGLAQYAVLLFALHSPARLERAAARLAERINRVGRRLARRDLVSPQRMIQVGANASAGLDSMRQHGLRAQVGLLLYGLVSQVLLGVVLAMLLLAFRQPASLAIVVASLGVAGIFAIVSPTPSGLGPVEAAMATVLVAFGLGPAAALIVSLAFRGLTLWLPVLYGFAALQALGFSALRPVPPALTSPVPPS
jgi:glycosyltransferase 2 family protein